MVRGVALPDVPDGPGCYTTAHVVAGLPRLGARHVHRLRRDAARLGLEPPAAERCREALLALAREAFPRGEGIVRLELRCDGRGGTRLLGTVRALGSEPAVFRAVLAPLCHPGPGVAPGAKLTRRELFEEAFEQARRAGADEAILVDADGRVVEGARTNLVVLGRSGPPCTPPTSCGAVAGVAREIALESLAELREHDVAREALVSAREIVALNAVRGARAVVELDGRPVGSGRPGALCARLERILAGAR